MKGQSTAGQTISIGSNMILIEGEETQCVMPEGDGSIQFITFEHTPSHQSTMVYKVYKWGVALRRGDLKNCCASKMASWDHHFERWSGYHNCRWKWTPKKKWRMLSTTNIWPSSPIGRPPTTHKNHPPLLRRHLGVLQGLTTSQVVPVPTCQPQPSHHSRRRGCCCTPITTKIYIYWLVSTSKKYWPKSTIMRNRSKHWASVWELWHFLVDWLVVSSSCKNERHWELSSPMNRLLWISHALEPAGVYWTHCVSCFRIWAQI